MSDDAQHPAGPDRPAPRGTAGPGWYPDPATPGTERWWDGSAWSDRTRPLEGLARPLTPAVLTNAPATAALVLGVVSLAVNTLMVTSLAAIVLGAVGLTRAGRFTSAGYAPVGRTKAVAGLVLAVLGAGGSLAFKGLLF